ncbi:hypothetical protein K469DRAFT_751765 [Zopfia rhizophila CBS 207.26]|uniref:Cora-domain-containing protein n=1 Tax=Zopfia rhizophila CBS 207.26 TaxID=1314779 RepID=A0A6A6DU20_9PEZI|nr:hypothetical protein K469DRAFT_751765 [Zopfia rhizophila CBS 207.26]
MLPRRPDAEPFTCLRNSLDLDHITLVDIRIADGKAVVTDNPSKEIDGTSPTKPGPHEPGIARIFLCPNEGCVDRLEDYLEFGEEGPPDGTSPRDERRDWSSGNKSEDIPYDLCDLFQWMARRIERFESLVDQRGDCETRKLADSPERRIKAWGLKSLDQGDAKFTFTELVFVLEGKGSRNDGAYGRLCQHKLYLMKQEPDMITIIWRYCASRYMDPIPACQKQFMCRVLDGESIFSTPQTMQPSVTDFLVLFLLEILAVDISVFHKAIRFELDLELVTDLMKMTDSVLTDYFKAMEGRIFSFNRMKSMVEKAEDIQGCCDYLVKSSSVSNRLAEESDEVLSLKLRCSELVKHTNRIDNRYQDLFSLNTTVSQTRQSFSVTILTVLAAVFLPLSLAAGVLSMQYRFNELGQRLYDFFGVAWIFCTFALVCGAFVRYGSRLLDKFWSLKHLDKHDYNTWRGDINGITYSYVVGWILVLISFLLGMFLKDNGIDKLGYVFLGLGIGIFALSPVVVPVLSLMIMIFRAFGPSCRPSFGSLKRAMRRKPSEKGTSVRKREGKRDETARESVAETV